MLYCYTIICRHFVLSHRFDGDILGIHPRYSYILINIYMISYDIYDKTLQNWVVENMKSHISFHCTLTLFLYFKYRQIYYALKCCKVHVY